MGKLLQNYTLSAEVKERVRREDEKKREEVKEGTLKGEVAEQGELQKLKDTFVMEKKMTEDLQQISFSQS